MSDGAALDTDVLLKISAYGLSGELMALLAPHGSAGTLGLTHLIAGRQLARKRGVVDRAGAAADLASLLAQLERLEPDDDEIALAAELASIAQTLSLPLDAGEAQLTAIVMSRGLPMMVTGDKRALGALSTMLADDADRPPLRGRLVCFEQVISAITTMIGAVAMRSRICAEPDVDGAMRLACSCGRADWNPAQLEEACDSYVGAIAGATGDLLRSESLLA